MLTMHRRCGRLEGLAGRGLPGNTGEERLRRAGVNHPKPESFCRAAVQFGAGRFPRGSDQFPPAGGFAEGGRRE